MPAYIGTIAVAPPSLSMMCFTPGVMLEVLHVEMGRSHAIVVTLVVETVGSGACFENILAGDVFSCKYRSLELRAF